MIIYNDGISWERKESGNTIVCLTPCLSPLRDGLTELVGQFGFDELAVEACNVSDGLALRAHSLASTGIGAVAEAQLFHLCHHGLSAFGGLWTTLWEESQLTYLRTDEEHGRAVFAGCHTGTASDA